MTKTKIELIKLEASEGMALTNGEVISFSEVYLGANDNPDNWHEISVDEAKAIEEQEAQTEEETI
jgi:hypothetical protein